MVDFSVLLLARAGYALCGVGLLVGVLMMTSDRPLDLQGAALMVLSLLAAVLIRLVSHVLQSVAWTHRKLLELSESPQPDNRR